MILTEDLKNELEAIGYTRLRVIPGRGICGVLKYLFTWGLIYIQSLEPLKITKILE